MILKQIFFVFFVIGTSQAADDLFNHDVDVSNFIDDMIRNALEGLKANMSQGFPQWGLPPLDPWQIGNIPLNMSNPAISLSGELSNLTLVDLSTFNIDNIHSNVLTLKIDVALSLPSLSVSGAYTMDGAIATLFPLYGGGPLSIKVTDVPLEIIADMDQTGGKLQVKTLDFNFGIASLEIEIDNLFNNQDLADVIDGFADDFGPLLVDILVNDTKRDLIPKIIDIINGLLSEAQEQPLFLEEPMLEGPRDLVLDSQANANDYFDRTLVNFRKLIVDNGLDPFALPDETIEVLGTGIKLHDGHLDGLGNVHRTGDAVMSYVGEWLQIEGHIGFNNLGAGYSCKVEVFHIGPDVTATASITETSVFFAAKISSKTLEIQLINFDIENVGHIDVDISGLGPFDWLLEPLADAIVNILKGAVVDVINLIVKPVLANFLASIDLMYILNHII